MQQMRIPLGYKLFLRESLRSLGATASIVPSSRFLSGALLDPLDFGQIRNVVELGCGTGAVTREILARLPADGRLFALDTNERFVHHLRKNCRDHRLVPIHNSAANLARVLARHRVHRVDAAVSSLGLTNMDPKVRTEILRQVCDVLEPGGMMTQYQYVLSFVRAQANPQLGRFHEKGFLRLFFPEVETRRVLLNLPPAVVFVCRTQPAPFEPLPA